jgi:hypothetical protein
MPKAVVDDAADDVPDESMGQSVSGRKIELLAERKASAKQIADSHYYPASDRTRVNFYDGTATDVRLQA